jgi:hypothetical protein
LPVPRRQTFSKRPRHWRNKICGSEGTEWASPQNEKKPAWRPGTRLQFRFPKYDESGRFVNLFSPLPLPERDASAPLVVQCKQTKNFPARSASAGIMAAFRRNRSDDIQAE